MNFRKSNFVAIVVMIMFVLTGFVQAQGTKVKPSDNGKSRVHMTVYRMGDGKYRIEVWEEPPKAVPGTAGGGGGGDLPDPNNPWKGVVRCRDLHWLPPPGTKIDGQPNPGTGPTGWNGKVSKGAGGQSVDFYGGSGGVSISTDPNRPSFFDFTPGSNASENGYSSLVATSDGGGDPPKKDLGNDRNVMHVLRGDDDRPLPSPVIFINVPGQSFVVRGGDLLEIPITFQYGGLPYTAILYESKPGFDRFMPPDTYQDLLDSCQVSQGGLIETSPVSSNLTAEGEGTILVNATSSAQGHFFLYVAVDDEVLDGVFPSPIDIGTILSLQVN